MALKSMTGFGEGCASSGGIQVVAELSSVNRKQLDINVNLPRNLITLDAQVQRLVRSVFSRGRISGIVRVEAEGGFAGRVYVDQKLATAYVEELRKSAAALNLSDDLAAETIARLPGVVTVEPCNLDADHVAEMLETALKSALESLNGMRLAEGAALEKDLRERTDQLGAVVETVSGLSDGVVALYREKLFHRLEQTGLNELLEDERIIKEIALFADRCDISEELVRLRSHLKQFDELLRSDEPVGRTLDFLCQELFREINTIGSKANEVEITRHVLAFKTELERIREQVQNVE